MKRGVAPRRPSRAVARFLLALTASLATVCVAASPSSWATTAAGTGHISIVASAVDTTGNPVADLTASDLKAQLESAGATVTDVSLVGAPKQIIILLDQSATKARGPQKMIWNTQCVSTLASHLAGDSNFVVLGFSDHITELYNGPGVPKSIDAALQNVPRSGESALFEILKFMGETIAQQSLGDRTVLVVVSDGIDTASHASSKDVIRSLGVAGVPLFSLIVMDPSWNADNLSKLNARSKLVDISKATGGTSQTMDPGEVRNATGRIAAMLAGRYRIELDLGVALKSNSETKLTIDARRQDVAMFYADRVYRP